MMLLTNPRSRLRDDFRPLVHVTSQTEEAARMATSDL